MKNIYYLSLIRDGAGLTNQIFILVTGILKTLIMKKNIIIINGFSCDYKTLKYKSISDIFDLEKINYFLFNKYRIILYDKNKINFKIKSVYYGTSNVKIDITNEIINNFYTDNKLLIKKNIIFNNLKYDPLINVKKNIYITYNLGDNIDITEIYDEYLNDDIIFDLSNQYYDNSFGYINSINKIIFEDILTNIHYNNYYLDIVDNYIKPIMNNNINILHLRLENDAINHWSKINNIDINIFSEIIHNKYIYLIKKYINKDSENIILSYSQNNAVIDYLKNNKYNYKFIEKNNEGREINALVDLLISFKCNNIFIGNFNLKKLSGSTFSYYISIKLSNNIKKILIDLDNITDDEHIY